MNEMIRSTVIPKGVRGPGETATDRPQPTLFKMSAPLLDKGRSNTPLAHTSNMWATLKVYGNRPIETAFFFLPSSVNCLRYCRR